MRVEVRNNKILIDGYVNAVERESKVLYDTRGQFIEKIRAGVFQRALEKAENVRVLLDHEPDRELADTKSGKARLVEDNIGLRATVEIDDPEVIQKLKRINFVVGHSDFFVIKKIEQQMKMESKREQLEI